MYADNFEREGYTEKDFIASMKMAVSIPIYYSDEAVLAIDIILF